MVLAHWQNKRSLAAVITTIRLGCIIMHAACSLIAIICASCVHDYVRCMLLLSGRLIGYCGTRQENRDNLHVSQIGAV